MTGEPHPSTPSLPPEAAASTTRVGPFVLTSKLGAGGMGEVWKAWDTRLSRWVALKFLKGSDDEEVLRFQREAQTAARLSHPNIAAVHEVGTETSGGGPARHWIAMQFIDGRTLRGFPRQDLRAIATLIRDAARAIDYAHAQGVIHRDLKPDNLMIEGLPAQRQPFPGGTGAAGAAAERGVAAARVFVMDFGLARQTSVDSSLSHSGYAIGTPAYMPPEQARGRSKTADARSDVYSLGATLYELLAGRPPFEGRDAFDILLRVVDEDPKAVRTHNPRVDADLETIAHKCLEKSADRRYATAGEFADDLDRWLAGEPIAARPVSTMERVARRIRRHKAVSASLAALVLVVLSGVVLFAMQARRAGIRQQRVTTLSLLWADLLEKRRDLQTGAVSPALARPAIEDVLAKIDALVREAPDLPQGWYLKARGLAYLRRYDEALAAADRAITLAPDFGAAHLIRGLVNADQIRDLSVGWTTDLEESDRTRELLENARRSFQRAAEAGLGPEAIERWGLAASPEDDDLRAVADALAFHYAGDRAAALATLDARLRLRRSPDCLCWRGILTPHPERVDFLTQAVKAARGDAQAWFLGGTLRRDDDPAGARDDYDEALRLEPRLLNALLNRASVRLTLGDAAGSLTDAEAAIEVWPGHALAWFHRANARKSLGDPAGAERDFTESIRLHATFPQAWNNRANLRREQRDFPGALADFNEAIRLKPTAQSFCGRGLTREESGDAPGALRDYAEASALDPTYSEACQSLALLRAALGELDAALREAEKAVAAAPGTPGPLFARGVVRHKRGELAAAIRDYDEVIRLDPRKAADAYTNRGEAWTQLGKYESAIRDLDAAIRLDARDANAWSNRGNARLLSGDPSGARRDYDEAIRLAPAAGGAYDGRGVALHQLGETEAALRDFAEAIRLLPRSALARAHRADLRKTLKDLPGAIEDVDAALVLQPRDASLYVKRADLHLVLKEYDAVARDCDEALKFDPKRPEAFFLRGQARRRKDEVDGAIVDFEQVVALLPEGARLRSYAEEFLKDLRARKKP